MKIYFITGAPGSGKTYVADYIHDRLRTNKPVTHIGADFIRDILRANISPTDAPALHASSLKTSELAPPDVADKNAWGYMQQAQVVINKGIVPAVKRTIEENRDLIIEGVNCVPSLLHEAFKDLHNDTVKIITIVLAVADRETHLKYLKQQNDVDVISKMGKIDTIRHMQAFLVNDGEAAGSYICTGNGILQKIDEIITHK